MTREYTDIRKVLKTGDLVLFSGKGKYSTLIRLMTGSDWTHVGMVLKLSEYDFIALWESIIIGEVKTLSTGKKERGVQIVPLSNRIDMSRGKVAVRYVFGDYSNSLTNNRVITRELMSLRKKLRGKPYEKSGIELFKAAFDAPIIGSNEDDLSSIFCSELVAEAYKTLGLLKKDKPSNEFTPADFTSKKLTHLEKECCLSEEILIKKGC